MEKEKSLYEVTRNELFGRYIVAATFIKQGQLIIREAPTLLCPQIGGPILCFNCCVELKKLFFCKECSIAVLCNPACTGKYHVSEECSTLRKMNIKREDLISNPEIITSLRCLLWRKFNRDLFERFLQLESHLDERRDTPIYRRIRINIENILLNMKCISENDIEDETVQKICAVLDINTFDVRQPQNHWSALIPKENLRGLYMNAAMMAHDCTANVHLAVDDEFVLYVHAAVDIPQGCPIFFNYTNVLNGNNKRQSQLYNGKHFKCNCSRCTDPTEFGTELSSLKCPRCCKGLLRPTKWECSFCKRTYHESLIKMTLMEGRRRIDELNTTNIDILEGLSHKFAFTFHTNHYFILEIEQNLVRLYGQSELPTKNLRRKIKLCRKLLDVFKKIEPGISRIQAITMYELYSGITKLGEKGYISKELDRKEYTEMLISAENTLKNSIKYLVYEPKNSPEGRLTQNALSELKTLRTKIGELQNKAKQAKKKKK